MLWVHCAHQDYMDLEASHDYRLFESMKQANEWVERMKEAYTSGDVWIIGPATQKELLRYIRDYDLSVDEATMKNINNKDYYQTL